MDKKNNLFAYKDNFILHKNVKSILKYGERLKEKPLVSILMPIYNHSEYLERAINSVLAQDTEINYEVIVVDNNHPDYQEKNEEIVRNLNAPNLCYFVNETNIGPSANWNRCIELAQGDYFTFCHDDDMLTPQALTVLLASIKKNAPYRLIIGSNINIDSADSIIRKRKKHFFDSIRYIYSKYLFLVNNPNNGCGSLFHRESIIRLGGYNADYWPTFDYALNVQYSFLYGALKIPQITFKYRVTETSDSANCYAEIPKAFESISNSVLSRIKFFRISAGYASKVSVQMGKAMSEVVWEGKKSSVSLFNRMFLSAYTRIVALLNIRL